MCTFKCLNNLLFLEHLLGIYRNYSEHKTINKYLIIFQIFVQTIFHTTLVIYQVYLSLQRNEFGGRLTSFFCCYAFLAFITAMPSIVMGIYYSCAFNSYVKSINYVSERFKDDITLTDSFKKIYRISATIIFIFFVFALHRSVAVIIQYGFLAEMLGVGLVLTSQCILRVIILFQYLMFFVVIMIVFVLSKQFTSLITTVQKSVGNGGATLDYQCGITKEQIKAWVELYRNLSNCCVKVTLCFGRQFFLSIMLALLYYVMLIYQICYVNSLYREATVESESILSIIGCYLTVMTMPLIAGQKTKNQGVLLQRELVRLYNTIIAIDSSEAEGKLIKDFIRLTKKIPIEIKLISKVPAGMYLLPVILTLIANYLIVMLQFMHVV